MTRRVRGFAVCCAVLLGLSAPAAAQKPVAARPAVRPWMNAELPVARRAQLLLRAMTLEEKFWQLYMAPGDPRSDTAWRHGAFGVQVLAMREPGMGREKAPALMNDVQRRFIDSTRLGIPAILFEEGVHGLMQRDGTVFPAAIGLAATWDTALIREVATAVAGHSRQAGVRMLLSPVVNLARDPRWGRVEETYGEDAWLSAAMGVAYTAALERNGVVATPKHFVANHGDGGRDSYPVALDQATLEDLYLPPFRAAIDRGGARAIMASYNSVNGVPASASPQLLTRTLRGDWKFGGVVISDQAGVGGANVLHHTAADYAEATAQSINAGLDVIFQSGAHDAPLFWKAFRDGRIPLAHVDTAVARVLRLKFALGLFEKPYVDALTSYDGAEYLSRRAAEESAVLLRNERELLPLSPLMKRIALIGPATLPLGGYTVPPTNLKSLEAGWMEAAPAGEIVRRTPGPGTGDSSWTPVPSKLLWHDEAGARAAGLQAEYFDGPAVSGTPVTRRVDDAVDFRWTFNRPVRAVGSSWYAVRWTGGVSIPPGEARSLAVEGDDGFRLWVDDMLVVDADLKVSYRMRATPVLRAGDHRLRLEYRQTTGNGRIRLLMDQPGAVAVADSLIAEAVALARASDVAVVMAGVDEGEFRDRASLHLPGRQEELIARVAATGTPVVVVVLSGGAVITTPWMERVGAVLQMFYPGDQGASALSRLLHGEVSPGGRLPYTVPRFEGQLPLVYDHRPTGRGDWYVDLPGEPLFPFGFGLTYFPPFRYDSLVLAGSARHRGDSVSVTFTVRNPSRTPGTIPADEVAQLYVRHLNAPTAQPVLALRGFSRMTLYPGEGRRVRFVVPASALFVRDARGRLVPPTGPIEFFVGASSRDLRLRGTLRIQ